MPSHAFIASRPGMFNRFTPLPVIRFLNKLEADVPNSMQWNPPIYSFASFLIVLQKLFNNKLDSSRDLFAFMTSSISWFQIIDVVLLIPNPKIFLWIAASVSDAAIVNLNGINMPFANVLRTFFIKSKPVFSYGPRSLSKDPPNRTILKRWVFHNLILADDLFAKVLQSLKTCVLVNDSLSGELISFLEYQSHLIEDLKSL